MEYTEPKVHSPLGSGVPERSGSSIPRRGQPFRFRWAPPELAEMSEGAIPLGLGVAFLIGSVLIAWAMTFLVNTVSGPALPGPFAQFLQLMVVNPWQVSVGLPMLIIGMIVAGLGAQRHFKPTLNGIDLPIPRIAKSSSAVACIVLGAGTYVVLLYHLVSRTYSHMDIPLFYAAMAAFCLAVHLTDRSTDRPSSPFAFTRFDWIAAAVLCVISVAVNLVQLTNWYFAWVGDEYAFYGAARAILAGATWNFFDLTFVYFAHPVADSVFQAAVMRVVGETVFGWRVAEIVIIVISVVLAYLTGTAMFGRIAGTTAALVIGTSHYLMAYTREAGNNTHQLIPTTLALLMLVLAWRAGRSIYVFLAGASLGFCLYTFISAIILWPIVGILLIFSFLRRPSRGQLGAAILMLLGFALVVLPGLLATPPAELVSMVTLHSRREAAAADPVFLARANVFHSFLAWWSNLQWHFRYVGGQLTDPSTGLLMAIGIGASLLGLHRRSLRYVLAWFVVGTVAAGATHYVIQAPHTRLLFVMPAVALLAGVGAHALYGTLLRSFRVPQWVAAGLVALLLLLMIPLNLRQLLVESPKNMALTAFALYVRAFQEYPDLNIVLIAPIRDENLESVVASYGEGFEHRYRYTSVQDLPAVQRELDGKALYMIDEPRNPELAEAATQTLATTHQRMKVFDHANRVWVTYFLPNDRVAAR
jgi:4-amino-4-deoxy-L-arabinose transferase-like glycosyltransferase